MKLNEAIKEILGQDLKWEDPGNLDKAKKVRYYADAKLVRENEVFQSELNHYINELTKFCATMRGIATEDKLRVLTNVQFGIVVLETLRERFKNIEAPEGVKPVENPHDPI